jgi:acetyl-CoA carboxylase biotin carboxyl carrier protein
MALTFRDIAEILRIIDASQCEEVVIELEGLRLVVRRGNPHGGNTGSGRAMIGGSSQSEPPSPLNGGNAGPRAARNFGSARAELSAAEGRIAVRAPMVGTFYRCPSPHEKPFVELSQRVKAGNPLCLIEVMKLYTTIVAPAGGVIEAIAVDDASPVEFDQLLFVIKPD